jgi:hypothetical protein
VTNDQLRLRLLRVEGRLAALEVAQAARPPRRKRTAALRPDDAVVAVREGLWAQYLELEMPFGHGRVKLTKLAFAIRHRLNPDEFCRWFSANDKRGIPEGSGPDLRFRQVLIDAIDGLEARANGNYPHGADNSHGKVPGSQFFGPRPQ